MWKKCLLVLLCIVLPAAAGAEVVGTTGMYGDELIHRITAPNGQEIYFVSLESEPSITYADVNFDGAEDLVVLTSLGASNARFAFYIWDGAQYVRATWTEGEDGGIPNYELFPESGLIQAQVNEGSAGLLHHKWLYRWEGTSLVCTRLAEGVTEEGNFVLRVMDETQGVVWMQSFYSIENDAIKELLEAEEEALWAGLR